MKLLDLASSSYIAIETYRKNGQGVITPVWVTGGDDKLFIWTGTVSGKIKRIRKQHRVKVCASDARGTPKSEWIDAQARVLDSPEELAKQKKRMASKYGLQYHLITFFGNLSRRRTENVVIELSPIAE